MPRHGDDYGGTPQIALPRLTPAVKVMLIAVVALFVVQLIEQQWLRLGAFQAYLVLYPRVKVYTFVPLGIIFTTIALPAWVMLIYWMLLQVFGGLAGTVGEQGGGVAFWAHAGGFVAGAVLIKLFATDARVRAHRTQHYEPRRVGWDYGR